jgi:aldose 1-epimerase
MTPETITLRDDSTGTSAEILVSQGFNCFRFTAIAGGKPVEVLYTPPGFAEGTVRPSRGGIPILFPFPGRIPGTTFHWEGKEYALEAGDAFGNAIHGFVMWRPWRVIEQTNSRVVGQFHAWRDDPGLQARWPADFHITATYSLSGNSLQTEYLIENPGDVVLPCGLGVHPYFRVPLGDASPNDCLVKLPVNAKWELQEMLPTGRRLELPNAAAFQQGQRFGDLTLDDVFTGLQRGPGSKDYIASISHPYSGSRLEIAFDDAFRECVVFTPPHREAICIEPYTCVPGAFDLDARGIDAGLKKMPPGSSFRAAVRYTMAGG